MSLFNFEDFVGQDKTKDNTPKPAPTPVFPNTVKENLPDLAPKKEFFDLDEFVKELYIKTSTQNKNNIENQKYMSSYDVSSSCIANIIYKLRSIPVKNYANRWAPITLRGYIGRAIHEFIQENSNQFTENEVSLKVPSIRYSGRIDNLVNNNVLVEIKSLPYKDYRKVVKDKSPRINDFYQALSYKYILENYLEEARNCKEQTRSPKPCQEKYNIDYIQFIYIAHDIIAHDVESLDEAISIVDTVKKVLNSKHNTFYFMMNLLIDLNGYDLTNHIEYVKGKIQRVNHYMDNNLDVRKDDEYLDNTKCFFCLFSDICPYRK